MLRVVLTLLPWVIVSGCASNRPDGLLRGVGGGVAVDGLPRSASSRQETEDPSNPGDQGSEAGEPVGEDAGEPPEEGEGDGASQRVESEILEKRRGGLGDGLVDEPSRRSGLYWDQGPRLDALDGDLTVVFGGRLQIDFVDYDTDAELFENLGSASTGVETRRAFFEVGALYLESFEMRFMLDLADEVDYRDVFLGISNTENVGGIRVGYLKEPFGLEEIESSNDITFIERSLTDALVERRNLGVLVYASPSNERLGTASIGAFREADNSLDVGDGYAVTARVTGLPVYEDHGRRLVHVGVAASYREPDETLRFASRPESNQAPVLVDTGDFGAYREMRVGLEAASVHGPLSLQSEVMVASVDGVAEVGDPIFPSFYVAGSYVLTGEYRRYRKNVGAFGRVHAQPGGPGAWELTGRYSYLDLDSEGVQGGVLHNMTAGLNWYANFNSRVMFNYILANPEGFDEEHIFQVRLQLTL